MILSELIYVFKTDYLFECKKRQAKSIFLSDKEIALLLSKVCSEIQKNLGVLELSLPITLIAATDHYALNASVMDVKNVVNSEGIVLQKVTTDFIESSFPQSSTPEYYSILYSSAIPQLWLFPNPDTVDTLTLNYIPNFNLYSPSSIVLGDFGNYGIGAAGVNGFSGNTVFPSQYDNLILLGLMKNFFDDYEAKYLKEKLLMTAKKFNGERFSYNMTGVVDGKHCYKVRAK